MNLLVEFPEQTVIFAKGQPEYLPLPAYLFDDAEGPHCVLLVPYMEGAPSRAADRPPMAAGSDVQSAAAAATAHSREAGNAAWLTSSRISSAKSRPRLPR